MALLKLSFYQIIFERVIVIGGKCINELVVDGRTPTKIEAISNEVRLAGGTAIPIKVDVTDEVQVVDLFNKVDSMTGALNFVSYNAGNSFSHVSLTMTVDFFCLITV